MSSVHILSKAYRDGMLEEQVEASLTGSTHLFTWLEKSIQTAAGDACQQAS